MQGGGGAERERCLIYLCNTTNKLIESRWIQFDYLGIAMERVKEDSGEGGRRGSEKATEERKEVRIGDCMERYCDFLALKREENRVNSYSGIFRAH